jgi:TolB protein
MQGLKHIARRPALTALVASFALLAVRPVMAEPGAPQRLSIALPDFAGGSRADVENGRIATQIVASDLRESGLFAPIDPGRFAEKILDIDAVPQFSDWRAVHAQALVTGRFVSQPDGRLKVEFRLWDVASGQQLAGSQYSTTADRWPLVPHIIADAVYERLTGQAVHFEGNRRN